MDRAQRLLSAFEPIGHHFRLRRHLMSASDCREVMQPRFQMESLTDATWNELIANGQSLMEKVYAAGDDVFRIGLQSDGDAG